jgi:MoaA/NifB/PqqE/SkfB family radical SAM enzyme
VTLNPLLPAGHSQDSAASATVDTVRNTAVTPDFLWCELTGRCPLTCTHCYAGSSPQGSHGTMTESDWRSVIDQASALDVSMVQFIGGEPTAHPQFASLLRYAIGSGLAVEVYTNLLHVKDTWWELFACPNVSLATSWYSDSPGQHDAITQRRGSHAKTRANITEAIRRGIPLRAGIISLDDSQRTGQAWAELEALGVRNIGLDHLRQVGRGVRSPVPAVSQLCGNCGRGVAAISPTGDVWPCVFSRWMKVGNVRQAPLADILTSQAMSDVVATIPGKSHGHGDPSMCTPRSCDPVRPCNPHSQDGCTPRSCQPQLNPCRPNR